MLIEFLELLLLEAGEAIGEGGGALVANSL